MSLNDRLQSAALCLALSLAGVPTLGAEPQPVRAGTTNGSAGSALAGNPLHLNIQRFTLDNGLRVVLNPRPGTANVGICVTYDVGSRDEQAGQRGFAHLFEHMMFQGSRNVPKGDHFRLITARGGQLNGTTSTEKTNYFEVLPKEELALGLWLEADRMKTLAITQDKFENQRSVVQEEFRMRVTNSAYASGRLRLQELAFQGYTPYEHTAIGSMDDLDAAKLTWVKDFHQKYYAPNNAVLSLAGDFDPQEAIQLVHRYFDDAEGASSVSKPNLPDIPRQTSERLSVLEDSNAKTPGVYYGWMIPPARTPEHTALELAAKILGDGESSILHQTLVLDKEMARQAAAFTLKHRGASLFAIRLLITPRSSIDKAQKELERELAKLRISGPTEADLERAKIQHRSEFLFGLQTNKQRAVALGLYETLWGSAELLNQELERIQSITRQDVRTAILKHLGDTQRTIVEMYPPGWIKDDYPAILRRTHIVAKGDTLIGIANKFGVAVADITKENNIARNKPIYPGQKLIIPKATRGAPGAAGSRSRGSAIRTHTVEKGDSLSGIALKYGISVPELTRANNLTTKKTIFPGQELTIPRGSASTAASKSAASGSEERRGRVHVVKRGDSLSGIAKQYGVPVSEIVANNKRIGPNNRIYVGQKLVVPAPPKK